MNEAATLTAFLAADSEMARLIGAFDWARTPLGPIATWSQSLRTTLGILLSTRHPMFLWWGPELIQARVIEPDRE